MFVFKEFISVLINIIILTLLIESALSADRQFETCTPRDCGNGLNISYPFWISPGQEEFCGYPGYNITCKNNEPVIRISDIDYIIRNISYKNQTFRVVDSSAMDTTCPAPLRNYSFDRSFNFGPNVDILVFFYNCTNTVRDVNLTYPVSCATKENHSSYAVFFPPGQLKYLNDSVICESLVEAPVDVDGEVSFEAIKQRNYTAFVKNGFILEWTASNCSNCEESGGRCGFDGNELLCFCADHPHSKNCKDGDEYDIGRKLGIGFGAAAGGIILTCFFFFIYQSRSKQFLPSSTLLSRNISSNSTTKSDLEIGSTYFGVHIFTYTELKEATNNFEASKELGDGGFGTVYHGKLRDGRIVAVKRLYENNSKRVEQFRNEVEILTRLRHQNLVILHGCTSRHSRELLLVYEYVPNGTVADHLHGDRGKAGLLTWPIRMNIAIESASALAYLHTSDIIHRDVKTNNILLDNNFSVKVADFGLSRLFPTNATHVSTAPQGTPGYVDPKYYQCYQLTDKSDVYSFGVVLIELISSKPAVDMNSGRNDINLATMAISMIQNHALHELVDPCLGFESDYTVRRMMTLVAELAFRCLQQEKEMRPSMVEVFEVLRGIKNEQYKVEKAEEVDIPADDIGLLENTPRLSLDSMKD